MTAHFITRRRIEFCDTDMAGIVHFANFYRFMEQAEHDFFRSMGLKIAGQLPDGRQFGWPRVNCQCSFHAPAYYEDVVEIHVRIAARSKRSLTTAYEFWVRDTKLAVGEMKTVCCEMKPGGGLAAIEIPADYASALDDAVEKAVR